MDVPIAVIADYANETRDGKLNVMGIFDTIHADSYPAVHPEMRLVVKFRFSAAERGATRAAEFKLLDPDGLVISGGGMQFTIPQDAPLSPETTHIVAFRGVVFAKAGDYAFSVLVNDDEKARIPLHVVQRPAMQGS